MTASTGLSALPSALAALLTKYGGAPASGANDSAAGSAAAGRTATVAGGALGADPAFTLALGQHDAGNALIGYNHLAQTGRQFESEMAALETPAHAVGGGNGSVSVEVQQLAQAQALTSGPFGDADQVSLGTGTLSIETGTVDAATGAFTAAASPVNIPIANGSLNDIVAAINSANAGVSASVVEEGGGYALHLVGSETGAAQAFRIQGLAELAYDPAHAEASPLATVATAQDALYAVDGGQFRYPSNSDVPVAIGARANFAAVGTVTVARSALPDEVRKLVDTFNGMQKTIIGLTGKSGELEKDANLAAGLFKNLGDAATASFAGAGKFSQLADVGVSVQSNGTLAINQVTLDSAVLGDSSGLQSLINQVSAAMAEAVAPYTKSGGSLASQVSLLSALMVRGGNSLVDYLDGSASSSSQTGQGGGGGLASYLGGGRSSGASGAQNDLVSYLDGTNTGTSGLASLLSSNTG